MHEPTPAPPPALRAVPRTWSAVLGDGTPCRHPHHRSAEQADACAQLEEQVPGWGELGPTLRAFRQEAGMLVESVAEALECSSSKVSRIETGQCRPSVRDVRDILALYGVDADQATPLVQLARDARAARSRSRRRRPPGPNPWPRGRYDTAVLDLLA